MSARHDTTNPQTYDVIVSGTGIAGTSFGCILAKHGLRVLLIELGKHPRFALGEAMLPQSAIWPFMLGEYFGVPEIQHLSHADRIVDNITTQCGIKHSIGFAWHQPGDSFDGNHCHQLIPPHLPFYSESHLLREEVDVYLLDAARSYGCDYVDETTIVDVAVDDGGVRVETDGGVYESKYFVDSSGRGSVLAEKQGYRDGVRRFETNSRAIFAHVEGLAPFDDLVAADGLPGQARRLHDGTLHHVFDGGWVWVIPFDNFHRSTSKRASIGLMIDPRRVAARPDLDPEEEFWEHISQFPAIVDHLTGIRTIRPFVRTEQLQYGSSQSVGMRHFTTNNTFGFVDPLYSNGLVNTFETVFVGARLILDAFAAGGRAEDFAPERFAGVERLHHAQLDQADFMVANAYRAMGSFETWNAWTQLWLAQVLFHDLWLQRACFHYFAEGTASTFDRFLTEERPGSAAPFVADKLNLFGITDAALRAFEAGLLGAEPASERILRALGEEDWLPKHVYPWGEEAARHVDFSQMELVGALIGWGKADAPDHIRNGLFDFELPAMT